MEDKDLLEKETEGIFDRLSILRDNHIEQCCVDLIKEHLREDVTGWDKKRIENLLNLKGYSLIMAQNPIGSLYIGLHNKASDTVNDGYEIYLDTQSTKDENGDDKYTVTIMSKKLSKTKKEELYNGK